MSPRPNFHIIRDRTTADFVEASYRFEVLPNVGHYAPDQVPHKVTALLLQHLAANPL